VATGSEGEVELLCLGHILDPENTASDTGDIIQALLKETTSFASFEKRSASLGGRWLLFVRIGDDLRLYPDAMGLKPAFYINYADGEGPWVGSQPLLLSEMLRLPLDYATAERFLQGKFRNSWPGEITPYKGVRQLLPNHYLDLRSSEPHRFWPHDKIERRETETVVKTASSMLQRLIQSAGSRRQLALPLSGGHDSRILLACAKAFRQDMKIFTLHSPRTELYDPDLARKLAKRLQFQHELLPVRPPSDEFWALFKTNTAYLFSDPSNIMAPTFEAFAQNMFVLTGHGTEILKCYYYPNGDHPQNVDGPALARISGFEGNPVAIDSFSDWLDGVPSESGVNTLDLFCWENRIGNWCSLVTTGLDMTCAPIPAFNCRDLLEAVLTSDVRARARPYPLFRRICEYADPVTASLPFNRSLRETASALIRKRVSYRLWSMVHEARMKRAGLENWSERITKDVAMHELLRTRSPSTTTNLE
jgi:hypothetical protein